VKKWNLTVAGECEGIIPKNAGLVLPIRNKTRESHFLLPCNSEIDQIRRTVKSATTPICVDVTACHFFEFEHD
jgi:hypothetical protein